MLKQIGKAWLCRIFEAQVRRLRQSNQFMIIAVAGSVGKTSTKLAIGQTLSSNKKVLWQEGNYNDRLTVPLVLFNQTEPSIFNILAWLKILLNNQKQLSRPYPYEVVVLELAVDGPNQMSKFNYLEPDLVVLTAITPEHMEYFGSLNSVAEEELNVLSFSREALINIDDVAPEYLAKHHFLSYGTDPSADYSLSDVRQKGLEGQTIVINLADGHKVEASLSLVGIQGAKAALAAAACANRLGLTPEEINLALKDLKPFAGRMQILKGANHSTLIDDTYNASPAAVKSALDVLYKTSAAHRIAILGSINEFGNLSQTAHQEVGRYCDPDKLDLVVTIGQLAETYLGPIAAQNGCLVKSFISPYDAGNFVKNELREGTIVLAKGSQDGVLAEEALKILLADPQDASKLVRQSKYWLKQKEHQFK
ncbi:MAG TPA: Mur ligase family protein [Candidatus Dormibacteraeota bacterium]|nr:Mur ligase family protein [Candidatus Dormibacteraeota bacterium]